VINLKTALQAMSIICDLTKKIVQRYQRISTAVNQPWQVNYCIITEETAEAMNISADSAYNILHEQLHYREVHA
jgi:hypothetical protein